MRFGPISVRSKDKVTGEGMRRAFTQGKGWRVFIARGLAQGGPTFKCTWRITRATATPLRSHKTSSNAAAVSIRNSPKFVQDVIQKGGVPIRWAFAGVPATEK